MRPSIPAQSRRKGTAWDRRHRPLSRRKMGYRLPGSHAGHHGTGDSLPADETRENGVNSAGMRCLTPDGEKTGQRISCRRTCLGGITSRMIAVKHRPNHTQPPPKTMSDPNHQPPPADENPATADGKTGGKRRAANRLNIPSSVVRAAGFVPGDSVYVTDEDPAGGVAKPVLVLLKEQPASRFGAYQVDGDCRIRVYPSHAGEWAWRARLRVRRRRRQDRRWPPKEGATP